MPTIALLRKTAGKPLSFLHFSCLDVCDFEELSSDAHMDGELLYERLNTLENINCDG